MRRRKKHELWSPERLYYEEIKAGLIPSNPPTTDAERAWGLGWEPPARWPKTMAEQRKEYKARAASDRNTRSDKPRIYETDLRQSIVRRHRRMMAVLWLWIVAVVMWVLGFYVIHMQHLEAMRRVQVQQAYLRQQLYTNQLRNAETKAIRAEIKLMQRRQGIAR